MITEIGESKPELEQSFDLRLFDNSGEQIATFKESTFQNVQVMEDTQHIPHCEAVLATDASNANQFIEVGTFLQVGSVVEIWAARRAEPKTMLIRAVVDFVTIRKGRETEDGGAVIQFQARSAVSSCMDSPFQGSGAGSLSDLVTAILTPYKIQNSAETDTDNVEYYVDVDSGYAALRLLGLTFNAVVSTSRDGQIAFTDVPRALEQLLAKPARTITQDEVLGLRLQQGQPVRKRGE